jgi:hypothetical protein
MRRDVAAIKFLCVSFTSPISPALASMQSLQTTEIQMEGEIALDNVGESSTTCERFSDDEVESPTTN